MRESAKLLYFLNFTILLHYRNIVINFQDKLEEKYHEDHVQYYYLLHVKFKTYLCECKERKGEKRGVERGRERYIHARTRTYVYSLVKIKFGA